MPEGLKALRGADIAEMVSRYRSERGGMGERQKAVAEKALWDAFRESLGPGQQSGAMREWFAAHLDEPPSTYEHRQTLLAAGPWTEPLWALLDDKVALYAIMKMFRTARSTAEDERIPREEALARAIDDYAKIGPYAFTKEGTKHRRAAPGRAAQVPESVPPGPGTQEEIREAESQNARSRKFAQQLAALASEFVDSSLGSVERGSDEALIMKIVKDDFVSYVREAAEDLKRRVNSARSSVRRDFKRQKVSREQFRHACEVLNLPFQYGKKVDLRVCKKTMLKRAAPLHPDRNSGSHSARAEYQAVIESYSVLEKYMEGLDNGERSHESR